ncbi:MucB/RseB C-terminal domain-containing protein [Candidatus Litorirhabdus singularis]|nr:MucB/RseB C-terminal domain-containing protein [Candidatus Litorirhabdus singularis]
MSRLLALLLLLGFVGNTAAADCNEQDLAARQWLDKMSHSLQEVSYSGVFTYEHGSSMQTLRIRHQVTDSAETAHVTRLTGDGGSVMRTEHPLDCIHPGSKLVRLGLAFGGDAEDCGMAAHYKLKLGGEILVAGRTAQVLQILPRDMFRYGYLMALDTESGLLLKSQTMAQDGRTLERFQFADVQFGLANPAVAGTEVEVVHHTDHPQPPGPKTPAAAVRAWLVGWVPEGFAPTSHHDNAHEQTFTDGLAVFSVFLESLQGSVELGEGLARQGGTSAYSRGMQIEASPVLVTVIGEVPVNTARMVADSIVWEVADAD